MNFIIYRPPRGGFLTRLFAGVNAGAATAPAPIPPPSGAGGEVVKKATTTYSANASINKNGNLINDIFNVSNMKIIPTNVKISIYYYNLRCFIDSYFNTDCC